MGIPGLWAELAPAAQTTTLPSYCLTSFSENANELRGLRLGVDASLWLFHAQQSSGGANPYLRLLFYRLAKLLSLPVLPLFVFDGPNRPTWKRGKQVKGRQHAIEQPFTQLIEAFGYRWHRAPGEAEAELAYLNQAALVDAVLTDDSDALLFGAQVLIRNWGKNLSGKKALSRAPSASSDVFDDGYYPAGSVAAGSQLQLSGSDRDHLITLYRAHDLVTMSNLGIDRDGLILVALMSGGDYDATGLMQCGVKIALALARGGFGTTLIQAFKASYPDQESAHRSCPTFESFIKTWLEDVREELRTNERGFLPSRRPKLASSIEEKFLSTQESRKVLAFYVYPLTSEINNRGAALTQSCAEPDLTRLARLCQIYFHWSRDAILSKFRTILGPGVVTRCLRQEVLERNDGAGEGPWAALVESPASKAVRRHRLDLDAEASRCSGGATSSGGSAATASKATAVAAMQRKQRPLHESPNATRITDFFAKAALNPTIDAGTRSSTMDTVVPTSSVEILAIKIQRRHAALDPFLDYRVLVSMDEFTKLAALGVDARLDAELAANRVQEDGSDTDATGFEEADEGEHHQQGQVRNGGKKIAPEAPLLMWIPEPLLQLSTSGHAPLATFCKEVERKANASRTKGSRKAVGGGASSAKGAQTTLNSFVKPMAKPSLSQRTAKSVSASAAESRAREAVPVPLRTPRQLRVPSGMQRGMQRTESVPIALPNSSRGLGRTTFLPTRTDPIVLSDEEALDSSIEFLGALTSITHGGKVHDRSSTPPNQTSSEAEGQGRRLNKSPKKGSSATRHRSPTSFSALGQVKGRLPSQRALAEPTAPDSDGETDDVAAAGETVQSSFPSFDARLAQTRKSGNKSKPRISTIVIVDSSEGTP